MIFQYTPIPKCAESSFLVNISPISAISDVKQKNVSASACSEWTIFSFKRDSRNRGNNYLSMSHLDAGKTHSREDLLLHSSPVRMAVRWIEFTITSWPYLPVHIQCLCYISHAQIISSPQPVGNTLQTWDFISTFTTHDIAPYMYVPPNELPLPPSVVGNTSRDGETWTC